VLIEAMACGMRVVCTDLPGIQKWMGKSLPGNEILYVEPPRMKNEDEPEKEDLPNFEKRLAEAVLHAESCQTADEQELQKLSWEAVCSRLIELWSQKQEA